jgi:hypothetical protein
LYKIIVVSGVDAAIFLQGQLTQDIGRARDAKCLPAAWCNAQGRVLMTVKILSMGDAFGLVVPESIAAAAMARLGMYRLRSKVAFDLAGTGWEVFAASTDALRTVQLPESTWTTDLPASAPVTEIVVSTDALRQSALATVQRYDPAAWRSARIEAARVDISADNTALYTPHMLNLDRTGAISFTKGCYTGQEIVARTENLGRSKRRTFRYVCEAEDMVAGVSLRDGAVEAGIIVNVSGHDLLAVVPVAAAGKPLQIHGRVAIPQPLPYPIA